MPLAIRNPKVSMGKAAIHFAIIKNENRRKYLEALNQTDKGDINPFLTLVSESLIETEKIILEELSLLKNRNQG